MNAPDIFDRNARRRLFNRMSVSAPEDRWLITRMAQDVVARLATVRRSFSRALIVGCHDPQIDALLQSTGIQCVYADLGGRFPPNALGVECDEDRLPFADNSFDLVISIGVLDSVNDVPGALILIRRILKPDGLFLGAMIGADTIPMLKTILQTIDPQITRTHPLIDVRGAGDLLARAGFAMPVADVDSVTVRYAKLGSLMSDLRSNGLTNRLAMRPPMKRSWVEKAVRLFGESDRTETFSIIHLSGWCPISPETLQTSASRMPIRGRSAGGISIE